MHDFAISPVSVREAGRLHELEMSCFAVPWSEKTLADFISDTEHHICLAAREGGPDSPTIIGYIGFQYVLDEGEVANVAVAPQYRGRGLGRALLMAVLDFCRSHGIRAVHLEVRTGNEHALSLYRKCGFVQSGRRSGYYADTGEDALLLTWKDM